MTSQVDKFVHKETEWHTILSYSPYDLETRCAYIIVTFIMNKYGSQLSMYIYINIIIFKAQTNMNYL